jgi:hypothetical protein
VAAGRRGDGGAARAAEKGVAETEAASRVVEAKEAAARAAAKGTAATEAAARAAAAMEAVARAAAFGLTPNPGLTLTLTLTRG